MMTKFDLLIRVLACCFMLLALLFRVQAQGTMFDDFNYDHVNDPQLSQFNKWRVIDGTNGPPDGAYYSRDNIQFVNDPDHAGNTLMTLSTTVNGETQATTQSRIETAGFEYFEGTYAARVYVSDVPFSYQDANIQTFYTIVSHELGNNGDLYSELDFEYMASDHWGIASKQPVMYLTSWNRYIPDPWQAWKRYFAYQESFQGWHDFVVSCTDGTNVKYWIDGEYMGAMATTDNDGSSVYPRSPMQVAFANWIWNFVVGPSEEDRTTTMEVDWVYFRKDEEVSTAQVIANVNNYRSQGIIRENLSGQVAYGTVVQSPYKHHVIPGVVQAEDYDLGGQGVAYHDSDQINEGLNYRNDGVDVETNDADSHNVGYIQAGEWLEYTVVVEESETFEMKAVVANGSALQGAFHLEVDDVPVGQTVSISNTGGWHDWTTVSLGQVTLDAGEYVIRLYFESVGVNVDELEFSRGNVTSTLLDQSAAVFDVYPNPVGAVLEVSSPELLTGNVARVVDAEGRVVKTELLDTKMDVSDLSAGLYTLEVRIGNRFHSRPFLKE